ncbi:aldehyde dehydrogenase family protein [Calycomorphotria hydatis]|uniref:Aldehyde dehydrogenase B n=1 Tax=Calycomorphotria hydatis TaxID=2528027 RepID=A0A517TA42_9PLAN|nr:aldehyde dehydrogenase family protein [Calycomorphotria hydatis]QDT65236.1 Aldehyde dehydrogenase B [Calycomorphotria hydatis]
MERHNAVNKFLDQPALKMFVNGNWTSSSAGELLLTLDPGSGETLAQFQAGAAEDVNNAVLAAETAFHKSPWAAMSAADRAVYLHRLADLVDRDINILAQLESLDAGKPLLASISGDIPMFSTTIRYFADLAAHENLREPIAVSGFEAYSLHVPYGPCAFIIPWNFPFLLLGWGIAPALAAGNTVVVKPAEDTPLTTLYVCKLVEEAGFPDGVINVITGTGSVTGAALAANPRIKRMSFTGSPEVGRLIGETCGRNLVPVKLELGGKGAAVVFGDVDPEEVGKALAQAVSLNAGQVCCTATRWIVHEKVYDDLLECARHYLNSLKIGHELDEETEMGPVVSQKQKARVLDYLMRGKEMGADVLLQGGAHAIDDFPEGYFIKPCLLGGTADNICAIEEIFGPVAFLQKFSNEDEAVRLSNISNYGLANSVWSTDADRATRVAEKLVAGNSWINGHNLFAMGIPYGGCNLSGLGGGVNSPETFYDYLRSQSIVKSNS